MARMREAAGARKKKATPRAVSPARAVEVRVNTLAGEGEESLEAKTIAKETNEVAAENAVLRNMSNAAVGKALTAILAHEEPSASADPPLLKNWCGTCEGDLRGIRNKSLLVEQIPRKRKRKDDTVACASQPAAKKPTVAFPEHLESGGNCVQCGAYADAPYFVAHDANNALCVQCYFDHLARYAAEHKLALPGLDAATQTMIYKPEEVAYDFSGGWADLEQ